MKLETITLYDNHYVPIGGILEICDIKYLVLNRRISPIIYCKIYYIVIEFKPSKYNWLNIIRINILKIRYTFE